MGVDAAYLFSMDHVGNGHPNAYTDHHDHNHSNSHKRDDGDHLGGLYGQDGNDRNIMPIVAFIITSFQTRLVTRGSRLVIAVVMVTMSLIVLEVGLVISPMIGNGIVELSSCHQAAYKQPYVKNGICNNF